MGTGGRILQEVAAVDRKTVHPALKEARFTVACDVRNPFYGPDGAVYVFAPQKGASPEMVEKLEAGMRSLSAVIARETGKDISGSPGAGAAGGMGGSLQAFLDAELKPGTRLLLDALRFSEKITGADLVITGEGRVDRQTSMGKIPSGILEAASTRQIPVIVLAGSIADADEVDNAGFQGVFPVVPGPVSLEEAMEPAFARENLRRSAAQLCRLIKSFRG